MPPVICIEDGHRAVIRVPGKLSPTCPLLPALLRLSSRIACDHNAGLPILHYVLNCPCPAVANHWGACRRAAMGATLPFKTEVLTPPPQSRYVVWQRRLLRSKASQMHASLSLKAGVGQLQCTTALNLQALISPSAASYGVLYIDTIDCSGNCVVLSRALLSHTGLHVTDSAHASLSSGKNSFVKTSASLGSLRSSKVPALPDRRSSKLALLPSTCRGCGLKCCYVSEHIVAQCIEGAQPLVTR